MAQPFRLERRIDAKPSEVFRVLCDLDLAKAWHPSILAVKRLDGDGPLRAGSAWVETRTGANGKPFVSTIRVTRAEPDAAFSLHIEAKPVRMDCSFTLAGAKGEGTQVSYEATMKPKGLGVLFAGKMRKMMAEMDADLLQRLAVVTANRKGKTRAAVAKAAKKGAKKPK